MTTHDKPKQKDESMNTDKTKTEASSDSSLLPCSLTPEKINPRLFDLVRYMRAELHEAELITLSEYVWLCDECNLNNGGGSPSPRRLEDYDELRAKLDKYEANTETTQSANGE